MDNLDPLADKYFNLSPYNFSQATGGFYTASVDNQGQVSLKPTGIENLGCKMSGQQQAFVEEYSTVLNSSEIVYNFIVDHDPEVKTDSWTNNQIDIGDIGDYDKSPEKGGTTSAGALIHSTVEQSEKAKMGYYPGDEGSFTIDPNTGAPTLDYERAHAVGISAEDRVNGNVRIDMPGVNKFLEKDGTVTMQTVEDAENGGIIVHKSRH